VLAEEKAELQAAVADLLAVVDTQSPAAATLSPQGVPAAARDEMRGLGQVAADSLSSPQPLPGTPEYSVHPSSYLDNPFTRATLQAALAVTGLWTVTAGSDLEPVAGMFEEMGAAFFTAPTPPAAQSCTSDADCTAVDPIWLCNSWRSNQPGVCEDDPGQACANDSECASYYCMRWSCGYRNPQFLDPAPFETMFQGRRVPAFVGDPGAVLRLFEAFAWGIGRMVVE
jgi:hypothetical protein